MAVFLFKGVNLANRRMISTNVVNSAKFLMMPPSTQTLYFHLCVRADDDGVVEAFPVMRLTGSSDDELKILVAKGFVTLLNEELVTHISDWLEHNKIRPDRKTDSMYKELLLSVIPKVQLIEAKQRKDRPKDDQRTDVGRPKDDQGATEGLPKIGKDRLGEVSIGEEKKKDTKRFSPPTLEQVQSYCVERNNIVDPESFIDFYESKNWMVGKNKMKCWKASVRTWEKNNYGSNNNFGNSRTANHAVDPQYTGLGF